MKIFIKILIVLPLFSLVLYANIATITAVKGNVQVQSDSSIKSAVLGTQLEENDTVLTGKKSKAQIIFKDETIVTIGKNSHFSIAKYIYDDANEPTVEFELLKGAMRTITGHIGKIAPQKFKVKTKTATIGIRGTNFVVIVGDDGSQRAYCTYGAISVSINGEEYIVKQGFYLVLSPKGEISIHAFNPNELQKMKNASFGKRVALKGRGANDSTQSQKLLDNTTEDIGDLIVKDVSEDSADGIQLSTSLSELLAGYMMSNASYIGISNFNDGSTGTASLDIDFGQDTASVSITDQYSNETIFSTNPTFSGVSLTTEQTTAPAGGFQNLGTADGTFQEPTGNEVQGNFKIDDGYGTFGASDTGTYDVSTSQTLH